MAQVVWPGVQPYPMGGGEAPIAQDRQPDPKVTLDDTPEETSEDTSAATPMEVTKEGDGVADIDYVTDMIVAQGTWDPWPTPTQDTPLPAQDAPSSPQDDPTPAQEE